MVLFTERDYKEIKKWEDHTEKQVYETPVQGDYVVEVTHRRHRLKPDRMIYVLALNNVKENDLSNDDIYYRAEPWKFTELPPLETIQEKVKVMEDYMGRFDGNTPMVVGEIQ